jgi:hypothetical protein
MHENRHLRRGALGCQAIVGMPVHTRGGTPNPGGPTDTPGPPGSCAPRTAGRTPPARPAAEPRLRRYPGQTQCRPCSGPSVSLGPRTDRPAPRVAGAALPGGAGRRLIAATICSVLQPSEASRAVAWRARSARCSARRLQGVPQVHPGSPCSARRGDYSAADRAVRAHSATLCQPGASVVPRQFSTSARSASSISWPRRKLRRISSLTSTFITRRFLASARNASAGLLDDGQEVAEGEGRPGGRNGHTLPVSPAEACQLVPNNTRVVRPGRHRRACEGHALSARTRNPLHSRVFGSVPAGFQPAHPPPEADHPRRLACHRRARLSLVPLPAW